MADFLLDYSLEELEALITPKFRAKQIFQWVYRQNGTDFEQISTLPKTLRTELAERFTLDSVRIKHKSEGRDRSVKYLFELADSRTIETVFLVMRPTDDEKKPLYTICVSSQVGCKVGCAFCMTGKSGFVRNLSAGEIAAQVLLVRRDQLIAPEKGVNVVYMGMGEPLDNLENVAKAVKILQTEAGLSISPRRQTISTSAIVPKIDLLGAMNLGVLLAISLHAVDNETRAKLIPINKAYPIESVVEAVKRFPIDLRKRVLFEYLMIKDINDSPSGAKKLVKILDGIQAKVNLIAFNPHAGSEFQRPERAAMESFQRYLLDHGIFCTIRQSRGLDIDAACGQLRERIESDVSRETLSAQSKQSGGQNGDVSRETI